MRSARRGRVPAAAATDRDPELVKAVIAERVAERAEQWFPAVGPRPSVMLRPMNSRDRSQVYAVHLHGSDAPQLLAKVRQAREGRTPRQPTGRRPKLVSEALGVSEQTRLEFSGLEGIYRAFGTTDPLFRAVRPLELLADDNAILMEFLPGASLRQALSTGSRLSLRLGKRHHDVRSAWQHAGGWLRSFQQALPPSALPQRQSSRDDVAELFLRYGDFLHRCLGSRGTRDIGRIGAELALEVLPSRLPMVVGHGDYAPRNVLVVADDRLAVIDPLPRWSVPAYEDLSRFLVGIRLLGLQLHSHGLAYPRGELERFERDVIDGYQATDPVPVTALRCYELLILLDKWSALLDRPLGGLRARLATASARLSSPYVEEQARVTLARAREAAG